MSKRNARNKSANGSREYRSAARSMRERDEHRMARRTGIRRIEFALPFVELREALRFVGEIIGNVRA